MDVRLPRHSLIRFLDEKHTSVTRVRCFCSRGKASYAPKGAEYCLNLPQQKTDPCQQIWQRSGRSHFSADTKWGSAAI